MFHISHVGGVRKMPKKVSRIIWMATKVLLQTPFYRSEKSVAQFFSLKGKRVTVVVKMQNAEKKP